MGQSLTPSNHQNLFQSNNIPQPQKSHDFANNYPEGRDTRACPRLPPSTTFTPWALEVELNSSWELRVWRYLPS